jgi:hypothetical protein
MIYTYRASCHHDDIHEAVLHVVIPITAQSEEQALSKGRQLVDQMQDLIVQVDSSEVWDSTIPYQN